MPIPLNPILRAADIHRFQHTDEDRALFRSQLRNFVPPNAFDVHAHLYDLQHLVPDAEERDFAGPPEINHSTMLAAMRSWMGDRVPRSGLYFPFPLKGLDCDLANRFLADSIRNAEGSLGLMLITPADNPTTVEKKLKDLRFAGFKVYHVFGNRTDSYQSRQEEFLPEWAWELADQHSLAIMMHMVLPTALSDKQNQDYIANRCRRYPQAKLVLAHAARGFNSNHTVEGIDAIRGLDNVWFDTSAICESSAFESILRTFGTSRLMYGSDFPVSELRGRCVSVGNGFYWLHDHNSQIDEDTHARPTLVGIESLLALRQACRTLHLNDSDIENLFVHNARHMLGFSGLRHSDNGKESNVQKLYREAKVLIPGGTQLLSKRPEMFAPNAWPAYYDQAIGCEIIDMDGRRYIDMSHCGILSCILGYADPDVNAAVARRVTLGSMATLQTADEVELAKLLTKIHPWAEQARFTRSGGEAMAVAVRIARAATRKSKVIVCGYHGWHDWYLAANLSTGNSRDFQLDGHLLPGLEPIGVPDSLGGTVKTFSYNQLDEFDAAIDECDGDLAAVIMEPTRSIDPQNGFLQVVRRRVSEQSALLVFDEISSGWRLCLGGAHLLYGVNPDLAVFAKGMSNGFAMGAVIGQRHAMDACQSSFISSTYWTEGIGPAAAVAAIQKMQRVDVPAHLTRLGSRVMDGWQQLSEKHRVPVNIGGRPAACVLSFEHQENDALLTLLTTRMLDLGFLATANCSLTLAHEERHVERYLGALDSVFAEIRQAVESDDICDRLSGPVKHSGFKRLAQ